MYPNEFLILTPIYPLLKSVLKGKAHPSSNKISPNEIHVFLSLMVSELLNNLRIENSLDDFAIKLLVDNPAIEINK